MREILKKHFILRFLELSIVFSFVTFFAFPTNIILLDGRTCSGKSTTAKALTELLQNQGKNAVNISIDDYIGDIGYNSPVFNDFCRKSPFNNIGNDFNNVLAFTYDIFHQLIEANAKDPNIYFIIVDHCFLYESIFGCALLRLRKFNIFFIKIYCNYQTALKRLNFRNSIPGKENRFSTSVAFHFGEIRSPITGSLIDFHANRIYDLEIDSTNTPPYERAKKIISILNREPTAFVMNFLSDYWTEKINSFYSQKIIDFFLSEEELVSIYSCF